MIKAFKNITDQYKEIQIQVKLLNPLHPNINIHILHTALYTFT